VLTLAGGPSSDLSASSFETCVLLSSRPARCASHFPPFLGDGRGGTTGDGFGVLLGRFRFRHSLVASGVGDLIGLFIRGMGPLLGKNRIVDDFLTVVLGEDDCTHERSISWFPVGVVVVSREGVTTSAADGRGRSLLGPCISG